MQMIARIAVGCAGASRSGEAVTSRGAGTGELLRWGRDPIGAAGIETTALHAEQGVPLVTGTGSTCHDRPCRDGKGRGFLVVERPRRYPEDHTRRDGADPVRATVIHGPGDVRVEDVPDPALREPTDAIVRVLRACICGSDLWPYGSMEASERGRRIGHEFLGVVEELGTEVSELEPGDVVVAPFVWADNTCDF